MRCDSRFGSDDIASSRAGSPEWEASMRDVDSPAGPVRNSCYLSGKSGKRYASKRSQPDPKPAEFMSEARSDESSESRSSMDRSLSELAHRWRSSASSLRRLGLPALTTFCAC